MEATHAGPPRRAALLSFVAMLLVGIALAGCRDEESSRAEVERGLWGAVLNPGGEPVRGGTLRVDQPLAPSCLNPVCLLSGNSQNTTNQSVQAIATMFDQLVQLVPGSVEPKPGLAKSWTVSEDGLTYTFDLRRAKFSNGMPVTSADVKYVLDFARRPDAFLSDLVSAVARVETPNDSTVVLKLSQPAPGLIYWLASPVMSIVPARVVKAVGADNFNEQPVGSGPFKLKRWLRGQEIQLVRNERYWRKGQPYLAELNLRATTNDNTRVLNVLSGTTDAADSVPFSQIQRIDASGKASVLVSPGLDMYNVLINNAKEPLADVRVRQALYYATPVKSIIDVVFHGHAPQMNTVMQKLRYWTDKSKPYSYDPKKAKQLLAESSVPDGFDANILIIGGDALSGQTAQILQSAWAKIGVRLKILPLDEATQGERWTSGDYDMLLFEPGSDTSDVPVEDEFATLLFNSPATDNFWTFSKNAELKKIVQAATQEVDGDERAKLFEQMHILSMKHLPMIPLVYTPNRIAVANRVHNFNFMITTFWRFETVWVD